MLACARQRGTRRNPPTGRSVWPGERHARHEPFARRAGCRTRHGFRFGHNYRTLAGALGTGDYRGDSSHDPRRYFDQVVSVDSGRFPTAVFAGLGDEPVSDELAAELQEVLDTSANGDGLTATLITPEGTWNGATGFAAGDRAMVPNDQMSIASITKTLVAAQVMQLVEAGELGLDDLAADRLPPDLEFDTNGATIENLLSMRSGIPEYMADEDELRESLLTDPLHVWTTDEKLATVGPERGPVGQEWEYIGTNYLLLGLIIEHVTGRPLAEVLRSGVLDGDGYERLIYQPDERPTDPMAMPSGDPGRHASTTSADISRRSPPRPCSPPRAPWLRTH